MRNAALFAIMFAAAASSASANSGAIKGDRAFGEYLAGECTSCHQISGRATAGIPSIIGYPEDQFIALMQSYAKKERDNAVMQTVAFKFKDDELAALAAYFGSLKKK